MPRKPTQQQLFDELLSTYELKIAEAFRAAVAEVGAKADLGAIIEALKAHDITRAIQALHLDPAAYGPLYDALQASYIAGGNAGLFVLPTLKDAAGTALVIRFNARNLRAEQWLRDHSSNLIARIVDDQRTAVRTVLETRMAEGANPRTAALDIVGRISRVTGKRAGGILGLTAEQEGWASRYAAELSGTPNPKALERKLRDKRFDRTVAKAIRDEQPIPAETLGKMIAAYRNRALRLRGEMIGRSEALRSLNAANYEALRQAVEGGLDPSTIRRIWRSAGDLRVRHTHMALNGETVGLEQRFHSPSGALLLYPGDPTAPAAETIACRCIVSTRIDHLANLR